MTHTRVETLTDIPFKDLDLIVRDYEDLGIKTSLSKQSNGKYRLVASYIVDKVELAQCPRCRPYGNF